MSEIVQQLKATASMHEMTRRHASKRKFCAVHRLNAASVGLSVGKKKETKSFRFVIGKKRVLRNDAVDVEVAQYSTTT